MATSCTCRRDEWIAPEQHNRDCPESLELRRIKELELALSTAVRDEDEAKQQLAHLRARISSLGPGLLDYIDGKKDPRIKELEEALKDSETIIRDMHNVITKYVAS